jgi:2-keto-4-pentenoate hydratase/2-oxohepta-3-ene-1,7-dioic acid hydratase in catechol pathway
MVRLANLGGRASLLVENGAVDVASASGQQLPSDPMQVLERWDDLRDLATAVATDAGAHEVVPYDARRLRAPVPRPRQVFAIALNYRPHVREAGYTDPTTPLLFTKFPSCITGPNAAIALPQGHVDWEIEMVAVIGRPAFQVSAEDAWDVVAGLTVGQDLSERLLQLAGHPAQFSLAKSYPGFGPIGPAVVSVDELRDPDDLELSCHLNGEQVQGARTSEMVFSVAEQIEHITGVCPVYPGDLVFTGTPGGVGNRRRPPLFIADGDELVSTIEGLGQMSHTFTG